MTIDQDKARSILAVLKKNGIDIHNSGKKKKIWFSAEQVQEMLDELLELQLSFNC